MIEAMMIGSAGGAPTDYIHFWTLDADSTDEIGTLDGDSYGLTFNGQYAHRPFTYDAHFNSNYLADTADTLTFNYWIRMTSADGNNEFYTGVINDATLYVVYYASNLHIGVGDSSNSAAVTLSEDVWYMVTLQYGSGYATVSINGTVEVSTSYTSDGVGTLGFQLGNLDDGGPSYDCAIDMSNFRLYEYILTASELSHLYNEELAEHT